MRAASIVIADHQNREGNLCHFQSRTVHCIVSFISLIILLQAVTCPPLSTPKNGTINSTNASYRSVISFNCRAGYQLIGSSTRMCQANRTWDGKETTCLGRLISFERHSSPIITHATFWQFLTWISWFNGFSLTALETIVEQRINVSRKVNLKQRYLDLNLTTWVRRLCHRWCFFLLQ